MTETLRTPRLVASILLLLVAAAGGPSARAGAPPATLPASPAGAVEQPYVLHLPGIAGHRYPDEALSRGLRAALPGAEVFIFDWTGDDEGLNALTNGERHARQAGLVADQIAFVARHQPGRRIILTCHSGGAGIAAWALAQLPPGVTVDTWVMLAPALSPQFDLSPALARVDGHAYQFYSSLDPVLGFGTRNFGTIDRVKTDAAGRVGFQRPEGAADPSQYRKLRQFSYDSSWIRTGNFGDHIGPMMTPFARRVLAPLLLTGQLPVITPATTNPAAATTRPATRPASPEWPG